MSIGNLEVTILTKEFIRINFFWKFIINFFCMNIKGQKDKHYCLLFWAKHPHFYKEIWF